jgi:peptidoglycan/LPS O-acetylase OafA/YrhL
LGYRPALDGLRGLALLAIVAFHSQIPGVGGAFLSVSTFFTLSGFLITSVALGAHARLGKVDIRDFYLRRSRRLLPAAFVAIAGITVLTLALGTSSQLASLRGDGLAALFYVANWRLVVTGESYGAIFDTPSMFTHFWTLAIEEQFYIAFPVAIAAILRWGRASRRVLALAIGAGIAASTAWSAHLITSGAGVDRVYFGTDTRVAEILMGCLAAVAWERIGSLDHAPKARRVLGWIGPVALVAMVWLWHVAERTATWYYQGGLATYTLLTIGVIVAGIQDRGPIVAVMGWKPLVWVGTVSYAAYLLHWPILVLLKARTPLDPWARLAVGLALTLALSALSMRVLERPIRVGSWPSTRRLVPVSVGVAAVVAAVIVGGTALKAPGVAPADFEAIAAAQAGQVPPPVAEGADLSNLTPEQQKWFDDQAAIAASTAPRVAFFGDSTATMTGFGVADWAVANLDQLAPGTGQTDVGCGLLWGVELRLDRTEQPVDPACDNWLDRWSTVVTEHQLDIAGVQFGPWDVRDTQLEPGGPWLVVGRDAELDQRLTDRLDDGVTRLLDHVHTVVLVLPPDADFGRVDGREPPRRLPESDPARWTAFRRIVTDVAARHDRVFTLDLNSYLATRTDDAELRPDGIHFLPETTGRVAEWLAPELLRLHQSNPS